MPLCMKSSLSIESNHPIHSRVDSRTRVREGVLCSRFLLLQLSFWVNKWIHRNSHLKKSISSITLLSEHFFLFNKLVAAILCPGSLSIVIPSSVCLNTTTAGTLRLPGISIAWVENVELEFSVKSDWIAYTDREYTETKNWWHGCIMCHWRTKIHPYPV